MTTEASIREDWLDVLIKIQTGLCAAATDSSTQGEGCQKENEAHLRVSIRLGVCLAYMPASVTGGFRTGLMTPLISTLYCRFSHWFEENPFY
jgi:hypothetical protein